MCDRKLLDVYRLWFVVDIVVCFSRWISSRLQVSQFLWSGNERCQNCKKKSWSRIGEREETMFAGKIRCPNLQRQLHFHWIRVFHCYMVVTWSVDNVHGFSCSYVWCWFLSCHLFVYQGLLHLASVYVSRERTTLSEKTTAVKPLRG